MTDATRGTTRRRFTIGALAAPALVAAGSARAQAWPTRPITLVVNSDVGGSIDRTTRGLAQHMTKYIGQPVTVVNRPGAGSALGAMHVLNQPDDGYTLLAAALAPYLSTAIIVGRAQFRLEDFAFINAHWSDWDVIAVHKDRSYNDLPSLLTAIRDNPRRIRASVVQGSSGHVTTLMLLDRMNIPKENLNLVTYAGGGAARTAIAGGQVDFIIIAGDGSEGIRDFVRPLAVVREDRSPVWDAPVLGEALKPLDVTVPLLSGSMRGLAARASFRQRHPDRWARVVDAYKATIEDAEFSAWARQNRMGTDWIGPERTTEALMATHDIIGRYAEVMRG